MGLPEGVRDELARIVETVAQDGLPEPRDLDVALDAILCTVYDKDLGVPPNSEFSYVVAHEIGKADEPRQLDCYSYGGVQVFFGDKRDAASMLAYVRGKAPHRHWRIVPVGVR